MTLFDVNDPRPVHFVGIAGAGMSALAELVARRGITVTGCDASPGRNGALDALGIVVEPRHDPAHVAGAQAVVATSAMPRDHAELARARELGIPVIRRAEARLSASIISSNSIRCSSTGRHVGCITKASAPRTFS